jgi:signal transduction histidine kinase
LEGIVGPVTEKQADLLHAAREDCVRLQGIIDDLLDLARLQSGRLQLLPLPDDPTPQKVPS